VSERIVASLIAGELLVVFDVAMRERSMHRSAIRLGLTELDLRSALRQLDVTVGEAVFKIAGNDLTPTHRAVELAEILRDTTAARAK
jgi:DNA-binding transcriptional LysR family regulator